MGIESPHLVPVKWCRHKQGQSPAVLVKLSSPRLGYRRIDSPCRLKKSVMAINIFIYTKSNCPNCVAAKQLLKSKGLSFVECDMDDPAVRESFMFTHPDAKQMPQIFIDDQRVGGLAGLKVALNQLSLL